MAWVAREETFVSLFSISTAVLDIYSRASSLIQNLINSGDRGQGGVALDFGDSFSNVSFCKQASTIDAGRRIAWPPIGASVGRRCGQSSRNHYLSLEGCQCQPSLAPVGVTTRSLYSRLSPDAEKFASARAHLRPLLLRLEQARRHAVENLPVMINDTWLSAARLGFMLPRPTRIIFRLNSRFRIPGRDAHF